MCFSSTASFVVAGSLFSVGVCAVAISLRNQRPEAVPLAMSPLFFGLQQALEGLVWIGLDTTNQEQLIHRSALAYLFFAYGFWLVWLPWCVLRHGVGTLPGPQRQLTKVLLLLGLAYGLALWVPLLRDPTLVQPMVVGSSLDYNTTLVGQGWISLELGSAIYALIITGPLLLSSAPRLRWFAGLILVAFLATHLFYAHAVTSVWCFFSALLSATILWLVMEPKAMEPKPLPG